jgi:hypothetical protein
MSWGWMDGWINDSAFGLPMASHKDQQQNQKLKKNKMA